MGFLDDKVALVTGAGGGLGRSHALGLARHGARVVVNDPGVKRDGSGTDPKMADLVVKEIEELGGEAVANYDSVATKDGAKEIVNTALDHFGRLDVVVNNAGILRDKTILKMDERMWDQVLEVHLKGSFLVTKFSGEVFKDQNEGGSIINTTSYAGLMGNFGQANYASAKAGIYGLTLVTSLEFQKMGVNCNAIAPMAKTRMTEDIPAIPDDMQPEDITPMVLFLASPQARQITGKVFGIHGSHIFEYRMFMSQGIRKKEGSWTYSEIGEEYDRIVEFKKESSGDGEEIQDQVKNLFDKIPSFFQPQAAGDWKANILFNIEGVGSFTIFVNEGQCETFEGQEGKPTCVVDTDADTILGIFQGRIRGEKAFMEGKIRATNMGDMMKFGTAFQAPQKEESSSQKEDGREEKEERLNRDYLGKFFRAKPSLITKKDIEAYANATNDPNSLYQEGDNRPVPPIFPVRLSNDLLFDVLKDPGLNCNLLRLVHGEQKMRYITPLRSGDVVSPRGTITSIEEKGSGETITLQVDYYCRGEIAVQADYLMFIRGRKKKEKKEGGEKEKKSKSRSPWTPPKEEADYSYEVEVTQDQPIRYGHASGDTNPIHMDDEVARQAGLPGKILQGLCTMAFASQGVVEKVAQGDPTRLREFKVRFSRPVLPGDKLRVFLYEGEASGEWVVAVQNQRGEFVITEGQATVSE